MKYQITLFCKTGKYKPVSCIIEKNDRDDKNKLLQRGLTKISISRGWSKDEMKRLGYTAVKIREYDPEKIKAEADARYTALKEEKYTTGEWKRPKKERK